MSRLILIPVAILLLLVVTVAILITLLLDEEKVLELASNAIHEQTGATLTVDGQTSLSLFPSIGISLGDAALSMPGEQQSELQARALEIGVQLLPLLSGKVEINTLRVDGLVAKVESAAEQATADSSELSDEQLDAFYAARRKSMEEAGDAAGADLAVAVPLALNVQHLIITDSRLEQVEPATGKASVIELARLETTGLNLDGTPMPVELELGLPGEQPVTVKLDATIRFDQQAQTLSLDAASFIINGATAAPLKLQATGPIDLSRQVATLQLAFELGDTRGKGSLRYASFESPQIDTQLQLNLFDPALLALAGPEAAAAADKETTPASGDEPLPLDTIRLIDTRADLSVDKAVFDAHTVTNMRVKLRAVEGIVQVNTLSGDLHGGKLDLQATFNGKHNNATLATKGSLAAVDIAAALAAMESDPILTGSANLDWQLQSKGRSINELTAALQGPIKLATEQVVLKDMSVEQMLCQAVALTNKERLSAQFPADTQFKTLAADIQLGGGKARLNPLRAELPQIALNGTGDFNLLSQDFKASFTANLSPELEQLDHACRVSKRLVAVDWPVDCEGNVGTDPKNWCNVNTEEIIEDLAKYEAKRQIKKKAGKLLDKLFN